MRIGSLFSGIGGLELGLERAGVGRVVWQVERDPFCRHVLARHWPEADRAVDDVARAGAHNLAPVDLICGGFPCQDLSAAAAGKGGTGLAGARSGLWHQMRRIIYELSPRWVVVENVGHTWRRYVPELRRALWGIGYASVPLRVRAADVGARHRRARVFLVAGAAADVAGFRLAIGQRVGSNAGEQFAPAGGGAADVDAVAPGFGLPARSWMVRGVHGLPGGVDGSDWRRAGWTGARLRNARISALGNSVVPACAEFVGRLIGAGA